MPSNVGKLDYSAFADKVNLSEHVVCQILRLVVNTISHLIQKRPF